MSRAHDRIIQFIEDAAKHGATEIHLKVPQKPLYRLDRVLLPGKFPRLMPQDIREFALEICGMAGREMPINTVTDERFSFGLPGLGRFQVSLYRQRGSLAIGIYCVPTEIPTLRQLGFSERVESHIGKPGLMLVAGGERRTWLLASLVGHYNQTRRGHVVVLEDSLTVLHKDAKAIIAQREVGMDVASFEAGVKMAVDHRVDLLVVNEVSNAATADAVLWAAEHGIPTIACVSSAVATDARWWMTRNYTGERRQDCELRLDRVLHSILAVPNSGPGQVVLQGAAENRARQLLVMA